MRLHDDDAARRAARKALLLQAVSTARKCCCGGVGPSQDASGVPCARVSRRASGAADRRADDPVTRAAI